MKTKRVLSGILLPTILGVSVLANLGGCSDAQVSYQKDVFPILEENCLECHTAGGKGVEKSGLLMSSHAELMKGTKFGPVVVAGDPLTSVLNQVVEGRVSKEIRMPHGKRALTKAEQEAIHNWVAQGARDN